VQQVRQGPSHSIPSRPASTHFTIAYKDRSLDQHVRGSTLLTNPSKHSNKSNIPHKTRDSTNPTARRVIQAPYVAKSHTGNAIMHTQRKGTTETGSLCSSLLGGRLLRCSLLWGGLLGWGGLGDASRLGLAQDGWLVADGRGLNGD
jgi:hypothetical protein